MLLAALRKLFSRCNAPIEKSLQQAPSWKPHVEWLEEKDLLATLVVNPTGAGGAFTSIQAAINAADRNDVIKVKPGTYTESATITSVGTDRDGLDLVADGPAGSVIIKAPTGLNGSILRVTGGADKIIIKGFKIDGNGNAAGTIDSGIRVDGNSSATIRSNRITGLANGTNNQTGFAIRIGSAEQGTFGDAKILDNVLEQYQKGGILVDGNGSSAEIRHNSITGIGADPLVAQNGIQISRGASAWVKHNTITGNDYTGDDFVATGILLLEISGSTVVANNDATGNEVGLLLFEANSTCITNNNFSNNRVDGIDVLESNCNTISHNTVNGNGADGIYLENSSRNTLKKNQTNCNGSIFGGSGIYIYGGQSNTIHLSQANGNMVLDGYGGNGILLEATSGNCIYLSQTSYNWLDGISLVDADCNTIVFNLSSCNGGAGIRVDATSTGNTIQCNVLFGNDEGNFVQELGVTGSNEILAGTTTVTNDAGALEEDVTEAAA